MQISRGGNGRNRVNKSIPANRKTMASGFFGQHPAAGFHAADLSVPDPTNVHFNFAIVATARVGKPLFKQSFRGGEDVGGDSGIGMPRLVLLRRLRQAQNGTWGANR